MIRSVVAASLRFRFLVVAVAIGMMLVGASRLRDMPVDVFPEFAPPRVEVQTICLGLSAEEVEALVTIPLEEALAGVDGVEILRSKSVVDLSSIELIFAPGPDLLHARQLVQERVQAVTPTLPTWAAPPFMIQPLSATSRVMKIGVSSDSLSLIEMSRIAYWKIRAQLLNVPGVANIAIWGERLQQYQIKMDPEKLRQHSISIEQVMVSVADALDAGLLRFSDGAIIGTGGFFETPNQRLTIRHVPVLLTPEDMASIPIKERPALHLSDVATLEIDHQPLHGDAIIDDGPGLMLIVEKFPWANTLQVTRGVEDTIDDMRPGLPGMKLDTTLFRPATFIEQSIHNLSNALLIGCLLVILVLFAFLFEWRTAIISAIAIPLSLVAAGLVLYLRDATINTMILAGFVIALGAVVDDAIVDVENIWRRLREHRLARREHSIRATARVILDASVEVRGAVVYASLIEAMALVPVFFLEGLTGSFFRPLAFSYALAVLVSLGVALVVTPALSLILLHNAPLQRRGSPLAPLMQRAYTALLARVIRAPRPAYVMAASIALLGILVFPMLGQSLLPSFKERDFLMHWLSKPGTSQTEVARITTDVSKELRAVPGVRNFGAHIGQAFLADEVVGIDFAENWISVNDSVDYDATVAAIQDVVAGYPGLYTDVQTYLKERIREVLTGTSEAIVVRIYGQDLQTLRSTAEEVRSEMATIDGISELHVELQVQIPQVEVEVDLAAAQRYNVKPGDVRRAAAVWMATEEVGDVYRDGRTYDVHVGGIASVSHSVNSINDLLIDVPQPIGGHVRLGDIARVEIKPAQNTIRREGGARRIDVQANVEGRDLGSVAREVEQRLGNISFPQEFHAEVLGEYAERETAQDRLLTFASVAIAGILILLTMSFGSPRLALLAFCTLPIALVGGVLAAFATDGVLSLGSLVGFFTILGIVARNGIMQISHYQHLEQYEGETFGPALVLRGSRERLIPIVMTALTTGLALAPLVISGNLPGQEIEYPMAMVILGGLVTSTILNLFVLPCLYLRFGRGGVFEEDGGTAAARA